MMNVPRKNRTLSHPNFQSYRLAPTADPERQLSIDIPQLHHPRSPFDGLPSLNAGRYHAHIFDRFLTHHLAPGYPLASGVAQAAYVDHQGKVVIVRIQHRSEDDVDVSFHPVFQLTQPKQQEDTSAPPQQSPSIIAIDPHTWLAADGSGQVSTLTISEDDTGKLSAKARSALVQDDSAAGSGDDKLRPIKLVAAASSDTFVAQTIAREDVTVSAHTFASPLLGKPQWSATTSEPLLFASIENDASLLVGSAALSLSNIGNAQTAERASSSTPSSSTTAARSIGNHPFTWYQTTDALTVTFPLPASLTSADFDVQFKSHHISISIDLPEELRITELDPSPSSGGGGVHAQSRASAALAMQRISTGAFASSELDPEGRKLWGDVDPSASFWTWERPPLGTTTAEANQEQTGYLTLHLEKRHHGTRWTHLFVPQRYESAHGDGDGDLRDVVSSSTEPEHKRARVEQDQDVDDVPETIDPSERIIMLEGLEKYTSALGGDEGGQGLGSGLGSRGAGGASLLEDGFEDEDANVGRDAYLLHISSTHPRRASDSSRTQVLGLPIPSTSAGNAAPSSKVLIVKDEIDGLAFVSTSASSGGAAAAWEHKSTLPALAYVLASKQDASHRVYAHQDRAGGRVQVLAFEGSPPSRLGGGGEGAARMGARAGAGNLFVYYSAPATTDAKRVTHAESRVIRLGAGGGYGDGAASGSLIAVAKVIQRNGDGVEKELLLILCQNQLLVMPELLL
ncbi:hypothetical protein A4X09_0g4481 [Tilletia walkeri]|uniref:NudC domain-containing protein 1 n=1 Tax=Tilletia walkeri TaxID=117179 RepID=A0A8X7N7R3_9BASI|nr:hypothetical protein A4X09_0g4481 [Tilletia walkeri]